MDDSEFHRLKRLPPYVFAEVNAMKARARAAGQDVIDLGMGNPDLPTAPHIVAKLAEAAGNPRAHGYSASRGIPGLRKAQAAYYARRFGVELDPETEIIVTLGSKEGLANLAQAITSPGDIVLVPNPSYPIHPYGFIIAGGSVRHIPVPGSTSLEEFLPALERAVRHTVPKPIALVLNYPSNPTAQVVDLDFYAAIVDFCKRHEHLDPERSRLCRDLFRRCATAVGAAGAGRARHRRRVHLDEQDLFDGRLAHRLRRRQQDADPGADPHQVLPRLRRLHADPGRRHRSAERPAGLHRRGAQHLQGTARRPDRRTGVGRLGRCRRHRPACSPGRRLPREFAELGSLAFSKLLLTQANVAVSPGIGFGEHGDAHVRIALVENKHRIRQAIRNIRQVMADPGRAIDLYLRGVGDNITPIKARA